MRIAIIAMGSRGDVQPYIALGKGLNAVGHRVRLITHENFESIITAHGLGFYPIRGNIQAFMEEPKTRQLLESGNFLAINAHTGEATRRMAIDWAIDSLAACRGLDLLIVGVGGLFLSIALAEKLDIPLLQAYIFPFTPTTAFPAVLFPQSISRLGGVANWLSHHLFRQIMWQGFRAGDRLARQQVLNLPPSPFLGPYNSPHLQRYPVLYGLSSSVIAQPTDWQDTHMTGYWFLDEAPNWQPPADLLEFLDKGDPPIFIGFGSMVNRNPEATAELVLQAIQMTGQRAIFQAGWGGLRKEQLPDTVYMVNAIPHSWLFRQVAAVVHHGGAGTTAAGLRAGIPAIVIPFFGDQPFWGNRLAALGVGTDPIPRQQLTADRLAAAIHRVMNDQSMRKQAATLGAKIRAEDGVANAVMVIQSLERRGAFD